METSSGFNRIVITPHDFQEDGVAPYMRVEIQFEETTEQGQELVGVSVLIRGGQKTLADIQIEAIDRAQALLQRIKDDGASHQDDGSSLETWSKLAE